MPNPRIVVADDHAVTRAFMATLLASEFEVVATVADGQAAVETTVALAPDVVVLDIAMPVLTGFQAAAAIRNLPAAPRIVFATAHEDPEFARAAFALGASALVLKKDMLAELRPAVRRALTFHGVYFYDDAASLSRTVARFIGDGVAAGQPAVLIATAPHRTAIRDQLTALGTDPEEQIEQGGLVMLDAEEVLERFMVGGMPDAARFEDTMRPIMDTVTSNRTGMVRAYGEMVDVLWKNGREAAAVSLEMLWNQLLAGRNCALLCGYSLHGVGQGDGYVRICHQHSHLHAGDRS
jgi:CheY-like chemotaxis protein